MLVLRRKQQEQILIGRDIEVTVLAIKGNRVELGVRAPSDVSIVRNELERRVQCAKRRPTADQ
jgi:carbon storage regulator